MVWLVVRHFLSDLWGSSHLCTLLLQHWGCCRWHCDSFFPCWRRVVRDLGQATSCSVSGFFSPPFVNTTTHHPSPQILSDTYLAVMLRVPPSLTHEVVSETERLSYRMTLDKSNTLPWYIVSSCLQDLQTVTGPQVPLQLVFQLPAFRISFWLKRISVKQLFAFAEEKNIIYVITRKKIHRVFWYAVDHHVLIKNNV